MSHIITLRLNESEMAMMKDMIASDVTGIETRTEFVRMLLHREWNRRRKGVKKVKGVRKGVRKGGTASALAGPKPP